MYKEYLAQSFRNVEVVEHSLLTGEKQVVAGQTYKPGDRVMDFTGTFITSEEAANPTFAHESFRYALQVGDGIFLASESDEVADNFINHSCEPNCAVVCSEAAGKVLYYLAAIADIEPGDAITFDYNTTEEDLISQGGDFKCCCGSPNCRGHIRGYKYLDYEEKEMIHGTLPYLREKYPSSFS